MARSIWKKQDCQIWAPKETFEVRHLQTPRTVGRPGAVHPASSLGAAGARSGVPELSARWDRAGPWAAAPAHPAPSGEQAARGPSRMAPSSKAAEDAGRGCAAGLSCRLLPHRPQGTRLWGGRAPGQGGAKCRASVRPCAVGSAISHSLGAHTHISLVH